MQPLKAPGGDWRRRPCRAPWGHGDDWKQGGRPGAPAGACKTQLTRVGQVPGTHRRASGDGSAVCLRGRHSTRGEFATRGEGTPLSWKFQITQGARNGQVRGGSWRDRRRPLNGPPRAGPLAGVFSTGFLQTQECCHAQPRSHSHPASPGNLPAHGLVQSEQWDLPGLISDESLPSQGLEVRSPA